MTENFAKLFEESIAKNKIYPGAVVTGTVVDINKDYVTVNAGLKSEGYIPVSQFMNEQGDLEVAVGDQVEVVVEIFENGFGETKLSREKAKKAKAWIELGKAYDARELVKGIVSGKVKGGFTVELGSIRAFLPGSLVDVRPVRDPNDLEGKELDFRVIKIDQKRNNVVVSRRLVVESENSAERMALLGELQEGQEVRGVVKNLTDYGAFVDLGGLDGLLHITDMAWKRVKHPSEIVSVGQELTVKVLKFDKDKSRVSLGLKQLGEDPWLDIKDRYPEGTRLRGKVTNITDYGCFVEIEDGVEGLVHVSEMDWTNKNIHPSKVVQLDTDVEVMVLEIDGERRRISLGLKQCQANPWDAFARKYNKGDKVVGIIKSITDFGIFLGLEGNIDGLIHLSDLSWNDSGEEVVRKYKKGQELEALILAIDAERERISLGVKQLEQDPYSMYVAEHTRGSVVKGTVEEVEAKAAIINLGEGVTGVLRANEISSSENVEDARTKLKVGDEVEAKIINIDRKNRSIVLSIKAQDLQDEQDALRELHSNNSEGAKLGDFLKGKMGDSEE